MTNAGERFFPSMPPICLRFHLHFPPLAAGEKCTSPVPPCLSSLSPAAQDEPPSGANAPFYNTAASSPPTPCFTVTSGRDSGTAPRPCTCSVGQASSLRAPSPRLLLLTLQHQPLLQTRNAAPSRSHGRFTAMSHHPVTRSGLHNHLTPSMPVRPQHTIRF